LNVLRPASTAAWLLVIWPPARVVVPPTLMLKPPLPEGPAVPPARMPDCSLTLAKLLLMAVRPLLMEPPVGMPAALKLILPPWLRLVSLKVLVSCRLVIARLPLMSAFTVLAATTAPCRVVLPPLLMLTRVPLTWVLVLVTSVPCPLPLPRLAAMLKLGPAVPWPMPKLTPALVLLELELLVWVVVFCEASRLMLPLAFKLVVWSAAMVLPCTVRSPPVAVMLTLPAPCTLLPRAVLALLAVLDWLELVPRLALTVTPPALVEVASFTINCIAV
jgi:hypothetical protein